MENTADEAVAVKELISPSKRIILVTSAFHMYRAKRLFEKDGFEVIANKIDYMTAGENVTTIMDFLPSAGNLAMTEGGIREIILFIQELVTYPFTKKNICKCLYYYLDIKQKRLLI